MIDIDINWTDGDPLGYVLWLSHAVKQPTVSDVATVAMLGRTIIQQRTSRGVDVNGSPFAPYSQKGPYYREGRKYASYGDYKRSGLGRSTVDLSGRSERMRQAVAVRVSGQQILGPTTSDAFADEFSIGIWGNEQLAVIAAAHNSGAMTGRGRKVRLPERHWFDFAASEQDMLGEALERSIFERVDSHG